MDSDNKRAGVDAGNLPESSGQDSTNRARNRTIMLTPEMTGQVRARLVAPAGDESPPLISGGEDDASEQMQAVFRPGSWQPSPPQTTQVITGEDDNDWTRPISNGEIEGSMAGSKQSPNGPGGRPITSRNGPAPTPTAPQIEDSSSTASGSSDEYVVWRTLSPVTGFLVSFDNDEMGSFIELRQGRLIITCEEEGAGNFMCIRDETVSPMHAIMRVQKNGEVQVLDQLSESGTRIFRADSDEEELLSGEKGVVRHGDTVCFGERKYHVCLLGGF